MSAHDTPPHPKSTGRRPQSGPPLLAPVIAFAVLTVGYVVANSSTPRPAASGPAVLNYAEQHGTAITVGAWLLFSSAVPLALGAAVVYRRLRALGITAPGSAIALVGGVLAAGMLAMSAMFAWSGGRLPADAPPALARALADLSFLSGGPGYVVMFALFTAGISVPALLARLLPRAVVWPGLGLAALGMVAPLTLLSLGFGPLLPIVRFGGLVWLLCVAAMLPRTRPRMPRVEAAPPVVPTPQRGRAQ